MMEVYTLHGKGHIEGQPVMVEDGVVRHAPQELAHWVGRSWTWCLEKIGAYSWSAEKADDGL